MAHHLFQVSIKLIFFTWTEWLKLHLISIVPWGECYLYYIQSKPQPLKLESRLLGRNFNNLRYADDTTLMEESKEELKSILMKVKEYGEKAGLKLNIQKN